MPDQTRQAQAETWKDLRERVQRAITAHVSQAGTRLGRATDEAVAKATAERLCAAFVDTFNSKPDLYTCSLNSVRAAINKCAAAGLAPGGGTDRVYLYHRWNKHHRCNEVHCHIGVWGLHELARRTGEVRKIWSDVVREKDFWEYSSGTGGKVLSHKPQPFVDPESRGKVIGAYACALLENGEVICEPVPMAQIEQARKMNPDNERSSSPWVLWFDQMAQKVALRRLFKQLPQHSALDAFLALDDDEVIDVEGQPVEPQGVPDDDDEAPPAAAALPMPSNAGAALDAAVFGDKREKAAAAARAAGPGPAKAANSNARSSEPPPGEHRLDRDRLYGLLCDVDEETWSKERARVEAWDEVEALSVLNFVRSVLQADEPDEILPKPACMALG
jgi:recombination protein RecT